MFVNTTESDIAGSSDEAGLSRSKANGSAAAFAAVKSVGKAARPLGIAKQSATKEHELAESSDEVGPSWSKANGMNSSAAGIIEAGTASLDRRLQHTAELAFVDRVEVEKLPVRSGFLRRCVTEAAEKICSVASVCGG